MGFALFVGDLSWDTSLLAARMPEPDEKVFATQWVEGPGGVAANAAIACAMAGGRVRLSAPIGVDSVGAEIARRLNELGIDARLERTGGGTTRAVSILDAGGEKRLLLAPGAGMYPSDQETASLDLADVAWMHTAVYDGASALTLIDRCREAGVPWSLDLEPATFPDGISALARHLDGCDSVLLNARAAAVIGADAVDALHALGVINVIETLGPEGVHVSTADGDTYAVPAPQFSWPVLDTTGAGDALAGWLVAGRIGGAPLREALITAVHAASASVRALGASASYSPRRRLFPSHS